VELERVDRLLEDRGLFVPFGPFFDPEFGRPSIPMETYLRMMWLKHRYGFGYETLCREVGDSLGWRRFCRIPLGESVPHPTTLAKITRRCGPAVVDQLNETLLARAAGEKVVRLDRVRADSTVVAANVRYPSDAGLLAAAIALMVAVVARVHGAGGALRTHVRNRRRAARRRTHALGASLRRRSYVAINPKAAPGVDQVTWDAYGQNLRENLAGLLRRVHSGAYRASPSRRAYIA